MAGCVAGCWLCGRAGQGATIVTGGSYAQPAVRGAAIPAVCGPSLEVLRGAPQGVVPAEAVCAVVRWHWADGAILLDEGVARGHLHAGGPVVLRALWVAAEGDRGVGAGILWGEGGEGKGGEVWV